MSELDLDRRTDWPDDLRLFVERYPRAVAGPATPISGRRRGSGSSATTCSAISAPRSNPRRESSVRGALSPAEFRRWFTPRLQFFLSQLEVHHQVEDLSYFPLFRAAEPRLVRGFEVLEHDHDILHERIARLADAANAFLEASEPDAMRACAVPTLT